MHVSHKTKKNTHPKKEIPTALRPSLRLKSVRILDGAWWESSWERWVWEGRAFLKECPPLPRSSPSQGLLPPKVFPLSQGLPHIRNFAQNCVGMASEKRMNVTKMIKFRQTPCKLRENDVQYILYGKAFLFRQQENQNQKNGGLFQWQT